MQLALAAKNICFQTFLRPTAAAWQNCSLQNKKINSCAEATEPRSRVAQERGALHKLAAPPEPTRSMENALALIASILAPPPIGTHSESSSLRGEAAFSDLFSIALAHASPHDCVQPCGSDAYTALHWAAHCDEPAILCALILKCRQAGISAEVRTKSGATPLFVAASRGCMRACECLLSADGGADACAANRWGENALHAAAANGHDAVVRLLLAAASHSAAALDNWQRTPLRVATENGRSNTRAILMANGAPDSASPTAITAYSEQTSADRDHSHPSLLALRGVVNEFLAFTSKRAAFERPLAIATNGSAAATSAAEAIEPATLIHGDEGSAQQQCSRTRPASSAASVPLPRAVVPPIAQPGKPVLSKLVEFGCTAEFVGEYLRDPTTTRAHVCGRDSLGMSALLKFAAWDSPALIMLLVERCRTADSACTPATDGEWERELLSAAEPRTLRSALHIGCDEGAWRAVAAMLSDHRIRDTVWNVCIQTLLALSNLSTSK